MKKLSLLFILLSLLLVPAHAAIEPDCDEIWKQCYAHCSLEADPLECYDRCMEAHGC